MAFWQWLGRLRLEGKGLIDGSSVEVYAMDKSFNPEGKSYNDTGLDPYAYFR
jgi:hypothetical protein